MILTKGKTLIINQQPMGAVRMTRRSKYMSGPAQNYLAYKDELAWHMKKIWTEPTRANCIVKVTFHMRIPLTLSEKRKLKLEGAPHNKRPDIDNIIKGLFDAANGIIWKDDNQVIRVEAEKRHSVRPRIDMEVIECWGA